MTQFWGGPFDGRDWPNVGKFTVYEHPTRGIASLGASFGDGTLITGHYEPDAKGERMVWRPLPPDPTP